MFRNRNAALAVAVTVATVALLTLGACADDETSPSTGARMEVETTKSAPAKTATEETTVTATLTYFDGEKGMNATAQTKEVPYLRPGRKLATMETSKGTVVLELWEDKAPNTVVNFVYLANSGRYDGVEFHRVIPGFMAQTGDVERKGGYGGPGYSIPAEFDKSLSHTEGVLSMARSGDPDSGGSQFFIMLDTASHLDGTYAAFGKVISGMDVIHSIKKGDSARNGTVDEPDVIETLRVVTVSE